jgi:plasmid replication initiation protein
MKKLFARFFGRGAKNPEKEQEVTLQKASTQEIEYKSTAVVEEASVTSKVKKTYRKQHNKQVMPVGKKIKEGEIIILDTRDMRDIMELMEVPIVSISKNRTEPINYKNLDGSIKIKISCHTGHYLASIYDWDIILFVSSKIQEIINSGQDIPPRTLIVPRHELLKAIHKHDGKKQEEDLKASLSRLKLTGIETTIHNKDGRYDGGTGFLDDWGYTDRKDMREFRITLSRWLYEVACGKGSLLKTDPMYFNITSGLKKFLYRAARKHVGTKNRSWEFLIETLYERSGSEREFKKFKYDLRKIVLENDMPGYFMEWIEEGGKTRVRFINKIKNLTKSLEESPVHKQIP